MSNHLRQPTVKVAEEREGDEYLITRFGHVHPPINIINIYGQQEKGDAENGKKENALVSWNRLTQEMNAIENRN